jgi:hypothetical protein
MLIDRKSHQHKVLTEEKLDEIKLGLSLAFLSLLNVLHKKQEY